MTFDIKAQFDKDELLVTLHALNNQIATLSKGLEIYRSRGDISKSLATSNALGICSKAKFKMDNVLKDMERTDNDRKII